MLLVPKRAMSTVVKDIVKAAGMKRVTGECYALLHERAEAHIVVPDAVPSIVLGFADNKCGCMRA
jgi:hypothetical protein